MAIRRRPRGPVERTGDGQFVILLNESERDTFLRFLTELEQLLTHGTNDDRLRRLFPSAYHDDAERDEEYKRLMHDELLASRLASIEISRTILSSTDPLSEGQLHQFMQTLNSLRLVLGTMLDVQENDEVMDDDHPLAPQLQLYAYLGWLLEWVVDTLQEGLPAE